MTHLLEYTVPPSCGGMAVKEFARRRLGFSARVFTRQKYLEQGMLLNGRPCRSVDILQPGDVLAFRLPEERAAYPPKEGDISVLWENEDYMAVEKPPAMPVHPSPGHDCDSLLNAVAYLQEQRGTPFLFRPIYRLDKDTSGIVLLGKHKLAASSACVDKVYYAVCEGELSGSGSIDCPIGLREGSKILRECGHGDRAVTHWRALAAGRGHTLLALRLETGRTHQIRVHLSHLGHPLAGDDLYGGSLKLIKRQALHCGRIKLSSVPLCTKQETAARFPQDLREAFPWIDWDKIEKEEALCPLA